MFARISFLLLPFIICINNTWAEPITPEKRKLVDQLLEINQTAKLIPLMTSGLSNQILAALSKGSNSVDKDLQKIVYSEVKTVMREEFVLNNKLNDIFYGLYDEYFSVSQMQDLVNFFNSSAGQQLMKHSIDISKRSQNEAKTHAKAIGPIVQKRVMKLLDSMEEELSQLEKN